MYCIHTCNIFFSVLLIRKFAMSPHFFPLSINSQAAMRNANNACSDIMEEDSNISNSYSYSRASNPVVAGVSSQQQMHLSSSTGGIMPLTGAATLQHHHPSFNLDLPGKSSEIYASKTISKSFLLFSDSPIYMRPLGPPSTSPCQLSLPSQKSPLESSPLSPHQGLMKVDSSCQTMLEEEEEEEEDNNDVDSAVGSNNSSKVCKCFKQNNSSSSNIVLMLPRYELVIIIIKYLSICPLYA